MTVRDTNNLTLAEIQRLIGEQLLTIEALRLRMAELDTLLALPAAAAPETATASANGKLQ